MIEERENRIADFYAALNDQLPYESVSFDMAKIMYELLEKESEQRGVDKISLGDVVQNRK